MDTMEFERAAPRTNMLGAVSCRSRRVGVGHTGYLLLSTMPQHFVHPAIFHRGLGFDQRASGAHVAKPSSVDSPRLYGRALLCLRHIVTQVRVEVRYPLEVTFYEVAFEFGPHLSGVVQPFFASPPGEVRPRVVSVVVGLSFAPTRPSPAAALQPRRLLGGGGVRKALKGPLRRGLVDPVPRELDHDQGPARAEQIGYVAQGYPEIFDVVQGQARHDVVELSGIGELLDPLATEDGTFGRPRVDCGHVVAGTHEGSGQLTLPTTDF